MLFEARGWVVISPTMGALAQRMESKDLEWVVAAIDIDRDTGGNLSEILNTVSTTVRERRRVARHVDTLTAEGRLSGRILAVMPLLMLVLQWRTNPENLALLTHGAGLRHARRRRDLDGRRWLVGAQDRQLDRRVTTRGFRNGTMNLTVILGATTMVGAIGAFWSGLTARPRRPAATSSPGCPNLRPRPPNRAPSCARWVRRPRRLLPEVTRGRARRQARAGRTSVRTGSPPHPGDQDHLGGVDRAPRAPRRPTAVRPHRGDAAVLPPPTTGY